ASEPTEPEFIKLLARTVTNLNPLPGKVPAVEPLAEVATPQDARRARLLAYASYNKSEKTESTGVVRSRERIADRLSDQSLYDSISRLGVAANQVSFKF